MLTAEDILTLLNKHKDWYLVTDHTRNFELLMKEIPMPDRMLVETIGGPYDYKIAIEAGVRYPMHTLSDIDCAEKYEFPIMVVNAKFFLDSSNLERLERLHRKGVTFLVWNSTISDQPDFIEKYLGKCISLIYTDKWYPKGDIPVSQ